MLIGVLHEYSQIAGPRDADIWDLAKDAAGAFTFLGIYMIFDGKMKTAWDKWGRKMKLLIFACAVFLVLLTLTPVALWAGAYINRDAEFPVICDFESAWESRFLRTQDAVLERIPAPYEGKSNTTNTVGKLTFYRAEYPKLAIEEPYPDWTGYRFLKFTVYTELDSSVNIVIRIEDFSHNQEYNDRYNGAFSIDPGQNEIAISLDEIRKSPAGREMDMAAIRAIHLFAYRPAGEFSIYLDNFRLE